MVQPTNGQLVTEGQIGNFVDANGDSISFERQKDGTFKGVSIKKPLAFDEKGKVKGEVQYNYGISQKGEFYEVSVSKQKINLTDAQEDDMTLRGSADLVNAPVTGKDAKEADKELKEENKKSGGKNK